MTLNGTDEQISECVPPSAGQRARQAGRGWGPGPALHEQHMVDLARRLGIPVEDAEGNYTGLTHETLEAVMTEWAQGAAVRNELSQKEHELVQYKQAVGKLRWWLSQNTRVQDVADMNDIAVIEVTRSLMELVKTSVTAVWPVLRTMFGNVLHTLQNAGLVPKDLEW